MLDLIKKQIELPYMQKLLKEVYKYNDVIPNKLPFEILKKIDLRDINLVIIGQDPYATGLIEFGEFKYHYDGLAFSSKNTLKTPYSLQVLNKLFINTSKELGQEGEENNNLYYLLGRGVLLINTIWTVRYGKSLAFDHPYWYTFTANIMKIIQKYNSNVCFLLLGSVAKRLEYAVDKKNHNVFKDIHPAASKYNKNKNLYNSDILLQCLKKIRKPIRLLK